MRPSPPDPPFSLASATLDRWVAEFERAYLQEALRAAGGSVSEAARRSGVTRRHIQRLMKRHGMSRDA